MALRRWALTLTVALAIASCDGCSDCSCGDDTLAKLVDFDGTVHRDYAASVDTWVGAEMGTGFLVGDGVRTGTNATAKLELSDGSKVRLDGETVVRFLATVPGDTQGLDVEMGQALLEAGDDALRLRTALGLAIIESGSRVRLSADGAGLHYLVEVGNAQIESSEGMTSLAEGQSIAIAIGGAIIEDEPEETPDAGPPEPPDAGEPDAGPPDRAGEGAVTANVLSRGIRARGPDESRFVNLEVGEVALSPGTTLRLPNRARMSLVRGEERGTIGGAGEFEILAETALVRAVRGHVTIEAGERDVAIEVPGGIITTRARSDGGSASDVQIAAGSRVNVRRGIVEIRHESGVEVLRAGETANMSRAGRLEVGGRGPEQAIFSARAGESFSVRDPRPPTAIGFRFGDACPGAGVIELMRGSRPRATSRGEGHANLLLPPGNHRYRLRCVGADGIESETAAQGTVRVMRHAGTSPLPATPPDTMVDTDGRNYTVLYQNRLPSITVRWPRAPEGQSYSLRISSGGTTRSVRTTSARHALPSGELGEGTHLLQFQAGSGERRSQETRLDIRFDNAANTASVREPADGAFAAGEQVRVSGIALPGWSVSVGGTELPLDGQRRFSGTVSASPGETGIAIRLAHPGRGVHYYVRRAR